MANLVSASLDASRVCDSAHQARSTDGVHFDRSVYFTLAQIVANVRRYDVHSQKCAESLSSANTKPPILGSGGGAAAAYEPKPTGSMANPMIGGYGVLLAVVVILVSMDNFFGAVRFAFCVFQFLIFFLCSWSSCWLHG